MWLTFLDLPIQPAQAWSLGVGTVDGVTAEHAIVLPGVEPAPSAPPGAEPWSGRVHLDLWIVRDSDRVLRAVLDTSLDRRPLTITYGDAMTITPPPQDRVG